MLKNKKFNRKNIMKKFKIRKIIRESIKELIKEQNTFSSYGSCTRDTPNAQQAGATLIGALPNPGVGDGNINRNFVDKVQNMDFSQMQSFYGQIANKLIPLMNHGNQGACDGDNPMWQANLVLKLVYINNAAGGLANQNVTENLQLEGMEIDFELPDGTTLNL